MTLPVVPAGADNRGSWQRGWRLAGAALFVLLALGSMSRADDADPFSATVTVDATADTVVKARDMARLDGQRRALAEVVQHLSGSDAPAKLPKLDDNAITDLVTSFQVANERMSAVRYVADYTFHFRPAAIQGLMRKAGVAVAAEPSKPLILIPVYQAGAQARLWEDPNPWRDAWEGQLPVAGKVPLLMPLGDAADIAAIDAGKARAADPGALTAIARRNGGDDVLVVLATAQGPLDSPTGVDVTVRRYRSGRPVDSHNASLTANPGESGPDLLRRAAAVIVANIEGSWSTQGVPQNTQEEHLTAILPITGLDDWVRVRQSMAAVPVIHTVALKALSRQEATIDIGYSGSIDQLKAGLAGIRLDLVHGDPLWQLARSAPGAAP